MPKIMVKFEFVNKEGKKRRVRFMMDKHSYEVYHHPSVPREWTDRMMLEEYLEFRRNLKWNEKTMPFPVDDEGNEIEIPDDECQSPIEILERQEKREFISNALDTMSKMQREAFVLVYLLGYSKKQASRRMGISFDSLRKMLKRAEKIFEIYLKKEKFSATSATNGNF